MIFIESYTEKDEYTIKSSYLSFAKLAGSERASKTSVTGERLKEATKIGLSISSIGNVISALSDTKIKKRHIPYRDSRMTYLLADWLGGNWNTVFVGTINPSSLNINESLSTIRYMNRVSNISSISHQNINDSRSLLIQIDKIYKWITNLSNCGEILDIFEGDNKDVINEVTQWPKLTVKLLLDYLKFANNKPKHILFKGLLEPSRWSWMFPVDEFIAMLESLNKSFIKIELFSNRELLNQITKVDINFEDLDFLHYQLKRIDSKFLDKFDQNYEKASDWDK